MLSLVSRKCGMNCAAYLLPTLNGAAKGPSATGSGKCFELRHSYASHFVLEEVEDNGKINSQFKQKTMAPVSLAKSLACLPDEPCPPDRQRDRTRIELKRSIELRIKKKVKAQYSNGKFYNLMEEVIAKADTLQDSYDIIRLNSNIDLALDRDDICFISIEEQLTTGDFDIKANATEIHAKSGRRECLVFPKLKLRVIQEAIRIVLEVIYRPHFSKISHGCRSGRSHRSAIRYICKEIHNSDWWFTIHPKKEADDGVLSKLVSFMEEKVEDSKLVAFIHRTFDAGVLNLVFGGFPKGHGLPQEGSLSPILMNIYLDNFDREVFRISMKYEGLGGKDGPGSNLRNWIRRQIQDRNVQGKETRIYACRFMDEIFISVSGIKDVAVDVKLEMVNYLKNSLYLDIEDRCNIMKVNDSPRGMQFLGSVLRVVRKESDAVRAVHKLKDKVRLFSAQKQEIWDSLTVRIGKKWLAHSLKRIKESEIKALNLSTPLLDHISRFRKDGMKTDHWFKSLIKIWMQDVKANVEVNEEVLLSKYIAEPALPQGLRESFYKFQKQANDYISSETVATLALLPASLHADSETVVTKMEAPISYITKSLQRYGLVNFEGYARYVPALILQDDDLIINWFSGLVHRWLKWYPECNNFELIKLLTVECVRKSCIRTLAAKYRIHESLIEKKFESEMSEIPMTLELETEVQDYDDEGLMYGISHSGLCLLSLSRIKVPTRVFNCFVMGCTVEHPCMYIIHVKERQRFPGWITGFSTSIHRSLNGRRVGLCSRHIKDLYLGRISLQSVEFGALSRFSWNLLPCLYLHLRNIHGWFFRCLSGVPYLRGDETPAQGGRPGWAGNPNPRIGRWLRLLKKIAKGQGLAPEVEFLSRGEKAFIDLSEEGI